MAYSVSNASLKFCPKASKMSQWVKVLAAKLADLSLILGTDMVEGKNFLLAGSDFHIHTGAVHVWTQEIK